MNRAERRITFCLLDHTNVMAHAVYSAYSRILRVHSSSLSEKELKYLHKRVVAYKDTIDQLSALRNSMYRRDNGIARQSQ
jgi:hypothetical protein